MRQAGCTVEGYPWETTEKRLSADEIEVLAVGCEVLVVGVDVVTRRAMENGTRLGVVAKYGTGVDNIDVKAATDLGVVVVNAPGANKIAVAELTLGLMISLARKLPQHHAWTKAGAWDRRLGIELFGKTVGIIGLGQIGKEVARRCSGLGMRVVANDIVWDHEFARANTVQQMSFEEVLQQADIVTLHVPQTPQTVGFIGAKALALMKPGAMLVNTARGVLVNQDALLTSLASGRLAGAAVDVFAVEPPSGDPLLELDNFIVSPHRGARTVEARRRMSQMVREGILAVLRGEHFRNTVNPEVYADRGSLRLATWDKRPFA
jgi:D-3-phosphoglycerate dehydrogenase